MEPSGLNELWWNVLAYGLLAAASLPVIAALAIFRRGWLPLARLRPGRWTGFDVILAFCIMSSLPTTVALIIVTFGSFGALIGAPPDGEASARVQAMYFQRCVNISSPLTLMLSLGILFAVLFARSRTRPHHLGLTWARWPANLALGLAAFVVVTPIALVLHGVLEWLIQLLLPTRPNFFIELGGQIFEWEWLFFAFQTTVAAPISEEILFRGVLQGWLRRASLSGHLMVVAMTMLVTLEATSYTAPNKEAVIDPSPFVFAVLMATGYVYWMVRLARQYGLHDAGMREWLPDEAYEAATPSLALRATDAWREANASLAIYGSAMLFAALHRFAWPAPVPLLLLGLALGWLARRTQSLIGPIALHMTFNLVAFIALYGSTHCELVKNGNAATTQVRPSLIGSTATSMPASQLPLRK